MQEVLQDQLQHFFTAALQRDEASQRCFYSIGDDGDQSSSTSRHQVEGDADSSSNSPPALLKAAAVAALARVQQEQQQTQAALMELQTNTVAPLYALVDSLEAEKQELEARVTMLETSMDATPTPPLVAEAQQLRKTETLLSAQLQKCQESTAQTVAHLNETLQDGVAAAAQLPALLEQLTMLEEELRGSKLETSVLQLRLAEQQERHQLEETVRQMKAIEEATILRERVAFLEQQLQQARSREEALVLEGGRLTAQLASTEDAMSSLKRRYREEEAALAEKRHRAEQDAMSNPSSVRGELTKFWYDGRCRIADLEQRVTRLRWTEARLLTAERQITQLERSKGSLCNRLAALAAEVDGYRESEKKLRAQCAGYEAGRDCLLSRLAATVGAEMSRDELRDCCETIRAAAAQAAASSATILANPEAIQQTLRESQSLKREVVQLQRQKEQLLRYIQLREDRLRAILEQEALHLVGPATSSVDGGSGATTTATQQLLLSRFLDDVRQSANDVFLLCEESATVGTDAVAASTSGEAPPPSTTPHRQLFVELQQQYTASQEKLLASQRKLQAALSETLQLRTTISEARVAQEAASAAHQTALQAVEATNAALLSRVAVVTSQLQQLRERYTGAVTFSKMTTEGLATVLTLLRQSQDQTTQLRALVQEERRDMTELLRREAASWGPSDTDPHASAAQAIGAALQRLDSRITEAVRQARVQADQQQISYLADLVRAIQGQEERLAAARQAFEEASREQATTMAGQIGAAQQQWDSIWRKKFEAVEMERTQHTMQQHASVVLHRALERALASETSATGSATTAAPLPAEDGGATAPNLASTLQAIRGFLDFARQQPPPPPPQPAAPAAAPAPPAVVSREEPVALAQTVAPPAPPSTALCHSSAASPPVNTASPAEEVSNEETDGKSNEEANAVPSSHAQSELGVSEEQGEPVSEVASPSDGADPQ